MHIQIVVIKPLQALPVQGLRSERRLPGKHRPVLIGNLEVEKERELLDLVLIQQAFVAQDVALVPELLNNGV